MPITTDHGRNTRADYAERLDQLGIAYPPKATKADLHAMLMATLDKERDEALGTSREGMAGELVDLDSRRPAEPPEWPTTEPPSPTPHQYDAPATEATKEPESVAAVEASTELVPAPPADVETRDTLPGPSRWQQIRDMAAVLAGSKLVRPALRGEPDDVTLILLTGYDLGISSTMALAKIHVIEGLPSASAELMTALVRRAGHRLWGETSADRATVHGSRRDAPDDVMSVAFSLEDAVAAGLCKVRDGRAFARSKYDKPLPWEAYTADMLWARAVSRLCRRLFSDVLAGMTYTAEELGAVVDRSGDYVDTEGEEMRVVRSSRVGLVPDDCGAHDGSGLCCVSVVRARIEVLPDAQRAEVAARWKEAMEAKELPALKHLDWPAVPLAGVIVADAERQARAVEADSDVVDAEVVGVPTTTYADDAPLGETGTEALGGYRCPTCRDEGRVVDARTGEVTDCPTCQPF